MRYTGRICITLLFITIVLGWHSLYFITDLKAANFFMFERGQYKLDLILIPLLSPFFWWLGVQYDKAKYLAEKDSLTGLYNRRIIQQITPKLLSQMNHSEDTLTISVIDCNNFKQINDELGHKMGDLVLKNISDVLIICSNDGDYVARWGGDEFLIVSPHADVKEAKEVTDKIEKVLAHLSTEMGMNISVSIGSALYPNDAYNLKDLLIIADRNMYERKQHKPLNIKLKA
ncbi:GGDEF domain-containing protein [Neobacillus sp. LXY-1]|uniref:GGDEF domain-containing protein n=1 Tax=Neobacillus sp. LXY-1 TaxID=3379133 RepID=UPI003EDEC868